VTSMLHDALPLATTAAFTPGRAHVPAPAGQWQVALARAAAATEPAAPTADSSAGGQVTEGVTASVAEAAGHAPSCTDVAMRSMSASFHAPRIPGVRLAAPAVPALSSSGAGAFADPVPAIRWSASALAAPEAPDAGAVLRPSHRSSLPSAPHPAARIHLEQHDHAGMTVWLGADGDAPAVALKAAALLAELQRALPLAGHRLGRLVCNGVPVYVAPHFEKETS
jgi:hypothetical protein